MADNKVKYMDIKEFRRDGYLQEINRRFLHPLGLAMEVAIDDDGTERLGGIWDYRDDLEGIYYDLKNSSAERCESFRVKCKRIDEALIERRKNRVDKLGFFVENID